MSSFDPLTYDPFKPPTPHVAPPTPRIKQPRLFPEVERLFRCQRAALDVVNAVAELEHVKGIDHQSLARLDKRAKDTYTLIRNYLFEYAGTEKI